MHCNRWVKIGTACFVACGLLYAYLYKSIVVTYVNQRYYIRTSTLHSMVSLKEGHANLTSRRNITANSSPRSHETLFDVFDLTRLKILQEMNTSREEFHFLLTPLRLSWKVPAALQNKTIRWSMAVAVKSDFKRLEQRNVIRNAWGSIQYIDGVRVELIFVTGRPEDDSQQLDLWKENIQHGDILEVDQKETYRDIGLKALAAMQWIGENLPDDWMYFSADDDLLPDMRALHEDVKKLLEKSGNVVLVNVLPIICAYSFENCNVPERGDTKWTISEEIYPHDLYPPFCLGGFYGMTVKLASQIYDISRRYPYYQMDDVFITGFMRLKFCDISDPDLFSFDKRDKNCAISTKKSSNFIHLNLKSQSYDRLWRSREALLLQQTSDFVTRKPS